MIACLVTTFNRPEALKRSLPQIADVGAPVLVVDDGSNAPDSSDNEEICRDCNGMVGSFRVKFLRIPENRGLAAALNIGFSYWLADRSIEWISYFQDDVDVHPKTLEILSRLQKYSPILTGHDARAHKPSSTAVLDGISIKRKDTFAGVHILATSEFWRGLLPFPTNSLGTPKHTNKTGRGMGSDADWWICRDSPRSSKALGKDIICVPNLVRTFFWEAKDSSWGNSQPWGPEAELTTIW